MGACPFGAILERSQIIDVLKAMREGRKVIAMVAPSIIGQFPGNLEQIAEALTILGFDRMEEVAFGAEETTRNETEEFVERMHKGDHIMTTSCCPAYVETVRRHVPEMAPFVSDTLSPMKYIAKEVKKEIPDAVTVFIGPCVAKRKEALSDENTDYVLTFDELGAMLIADEIEVAALKGIDLHRNVGGYARGFATSCGVSAAILNEKKKVGDELEGIPEIKSNFINGLTPKAVKQLKLYAQGKFPHNFLEVMACEGGCIGGPCAIGQVKLAAKAVEKLVSDSNGASD
jgi:iron only hydrogenase large subunit-like protein